MSTRATSPTWAVAWHTHPGCRPLLRWTLVSAVLAAAATALFLVARRWAGADLQPLDTVSLVAASVTLAAAAACGHRLWHCCQSAPAEFRQTDAWWDTVVTWAAACWAAALSLPGSPALALILLWVLLAGAEAAWWWPALGRARRRLSPDATESNAQCRPPEIAVPQSAGTDTLGPVPGAAEETDDLELLPENLRQRMVRGLDERGQEIIYGAVRCDFAAGQRQQEVHLGFCPPLEQVPELSFEQIDGPPAKIHPALVQTFGACLEIRLPAPSTAPISLQIQFYACPPTGA